MSKVRMVVGSANVKSGINKEFALNIKAYADQVYPGLIKDIYKNLDNDEKYFNDFAPEYIVLREQIDNDIKAIAEEEALLKKFKSWQKGVSDADFAFC